MCAHYVVDKDGTIYETVAPRIRCRHAVGILQGRGQGRFASITELAAHIHAATARWLLMVAEYDRRMAWADWDCKSCAHWVSWRCPTMSSPPMPSFGSAITAGLTGPAAPAAHGLYADT